MIAAPLAFSQATCTLNAPAPIPIRAEGNAELLPPFSLSCNSPNGIGGSINVLMGLSPAVAITSKGLNAGTGATEATAVLGSQSVQATVSGTSLTFSGLSFPSGNFTITITNVRVDASALPVALVGALPSPLTFAVLYEGSNVNANVVGPVTVACALPSLGAPSTSTTPYSGCFNVAGSTGPAFLVPVSENFAGAFKTLADESGTVVTVSGVNNQPNSGTRFRILFSNVSAAVYVPQYLAGSGNFQAQLTASEAGPLTLPASSGNGLSQIAITGGSGEAVYEVTAESQTSLGYFAVPVYLTGTAPQLAASTVTATGWARAGYLFGQCPAIRVMPPAPPHLSPRPSAARARP